jgi:hypothetical protein
MVGVSETRDTSFHLVMGLGGVLERGIIQMNP